MERSNILADNISNKIWEVFVKLKIDKNICEYLAIENWSKVVGNTLSSHTRPKCVKNGILYVYTDSSVWAQELDLLKQKIIDDLNKSLRQPVIKDIIFLNKGVSFKKRDKKTKKTSKIELSLQEKERIDKIVEVIKDEELKETFKGYLISLMILKKGGKDDCNKKR